MKVFVSLVFALLLCCGLGTTALAAETTPEDTIVIDVSDGGIHTPPTEFTGSVTTPQPIEVRMETLGEVPYITKTYEIAQDGNPAQALLQLDAAIGFEQDGYIFTRTDAYSRILPGSTDSRVETQAHMLPLEKDDAALVLAQTAPYLEYDQGGYIGQLMLDASSIYIEEAGRENYGYTVSDTREYSSLDRQDAAYIPKTVVKNGLTLQLENVEWIVMGTTPTGDGLIPNLFKAVATYRGSATGSKISGYTASFRYTGTVTRTTPGSILVSVVFRGEPIPVEVDPGVPVLVILAWILGGIVVISLGTAAFLVCGKKKSTTQAKVGFVDVATLQKTVEAQYDEGVEDDDDE